MRKPPVCPPPPPPILRCFATRLGVALVVPGAGRKLGAGGDVARAGPEPRAFAPILGDPERGNPHKGHPKGTPFTPRPKKLKYGSAFF